VSKNPGAPLFPKEKTFQRFNVAPYYTPLGGRVENLANPFGAKEFPKGGPSRVFPQPTKGRLLKKAKEFPTSPTGFCPQREKGPLMFPSSPLKKRRIAPLSLFQKRGQGPFKKKVSKGFPKKRATSGRNSPIYPLERSIKTRLIWGKLTILAK